MENIRLVPCKRSCDAYQEIRSRHYIPNHGAVGQQLHYLIYLDKEIVGIISGGAAAYAVRCRDEFFGITKENRHAALNSIIDNTVFRLEWNAPNLGTQILSLWRKTVAKDWYTHYGVKVAGFETFLVEADNRKGSLYKADNWTFVGETQGSSKLHRHGAENPHERINVDRKLVFCKWVKGGKLATEYYPTWNTRGLVKGQISLF